MFIQSLNCMYTMENLWLNTERLFLRSSVHLWNPHSEHVLTTLDSCGKNLVCPTNSHATQALTLALLHQSVLVIYTKGLSYYTFGGLYAVWVIYTQPQPCMETPKLILSIPGRWCLWNQLYWRILRLLCVHFIHETLDIFISRYTIQTRTAVRGT